MNHILLVTIRGFRLLVFYCGLEGQGNHLAIVAESDELKDTWKARATT
jgi:hypothetical protein